MTAIKPSHSSFLEIQVLLIRHQIDIILEGPKTCEIPETTASKKKLLFLIQSGSGNATGLADQVDVLGPLTLAEVAANASKPGLARFEPGSQLFRSLTETYRPVEYFEKNDRTHDRDADAQQGSD